MSQLARRLGLADATAIGVASMVGAGVFAVWGPAAEAGGKWLPVGLVLAALVAWCNASSSAQLAAQYPSAGGTYVYGREQLGEWAGYVAGWSFVVGKTASAAAMAMVFSAYWAPEGWERIIAVAAIWAIVGINILGVTRTATAAKVLVSLAVVGILVALVTGWVDAPEPSVTFGFHPHQGSLYGILQAGGLLFFAFAGYARIATMGEEVVDPRRTIRRAIIGALAIALVLYALVAVTLLVRLGPDVMAGSRTPLQLLVEGHPVQQVVLAVGAMAASAGALLGLLSGIGRTGLAMARTGDLPRWFDHTSARFQTPHRLELVLAALLTVVVLLVDLRGAIGFSSFGVLLYYFVANASAHRQVGEHRRYHRAWQVLGAVLCALLVVTLPIVSVVIGMVVVGLGLVWRAAKPAQ